MRFAAVMEREESSHKGTERLISDRMGRGGHSEGVISYDPEEEKQLGEEFLGTAYAKTLWLGRISVVSQRQ